MKRRTSLLFPLLCLTLNLPGNAARAETITLDDGRTVTIDPSTQKVWATPESNTPLWDGVHHRQDGSVLIIKNGVAISGNTPMPAPIPKEEPKQEQEEPKKETTQESFNISPCIQLSIDTCGFNGECRDSAACLTAKQLVNMEMEENVRKFDTVGKNTLEQCRDALTNRDFFTHCENSQGSKRQTPCSQLVTHVCGIRQECNTGDACMAAKQLLKMEQEERQSARVMGRLTYSSLQCLEAVQKQVYFTECLPAPKQ